MRILFLGAGAMGGYFGARLLQVGGQVTFLVRPNRADQLREKGLRVNSPLGDAEVVPRIVTAIEQGDYYDVIVLSCKAYDLDSAIAAIAPAVGPNSAVLPLLNGRGHLDVLDRQFGKEKVLGGVAHLAATLGPDGEIVHLNRLNGLIFGARADPAATALASFAALMANAQVEGRVSMHIEQDMWDKFVFLATLAAATCCMRANIGEILSAGGESLLLGLLDECRSVAAAHGHAPSPDVLAHYRSPLTEPGSTLTSSMLRDMESGKHTEGDHVIGDLIRRGEQKSLSLPLLKMAYVHVRAYERRRFGSS